jgi:spore germination protein
VWRAGCAPCATASAPGGLGQRVGEGLAGAAARLRIAVGRPGGWRGPAALGALAAAVMVAAAVGGMRATGRPPRAAPAPRPQIIGYFENGWSRIFIDSFLTLRQHPKVVDTVLAYWYSMDGSGNLREPAGPPRRNVIQYVRSHGMRMGVLINNLGSDMLTTAAVRSRGASRIAAIAKADGYQEIHIDFELLPADLRDDFTAFIAGLRKALPPSVALSVSVFPKIGVTADVNGAYDYQALARYVDYEVIMLYDNHSPGGPAGPVSPWPWVEQNVAYFRGILPASKIVVAAGVYGYDWPVGSTQAAEWPLSYIQTLAARHRATVKTDPVSQNPYFQYTDASGTPHVVWFQDSATVRQRIDLVAKEGLRGIAIWALGEEDQKVWQVLETAR